MENKPTAIILCDYWYPYTSANSVCVQAILSELERHYDVAIVAADVPIDKATTEVSFMPIGDVGIKSALERARRSRCLEKLIKLAYKPIAAMNVCRFPIRSLEWARRYADAADAIFDSRNVALVLAVSYPAEAVLAAELLKKKHPDVTAIGWFLDETAVGVLQKGTVARAISSSSAIGYEKRAGKELDGVLYLTPSRSLARMVHGEGNPKLALADPPLLSKTKVRYSWSPSCSKPIKILYTGTLFDPDRNPTRFVEGMRERCQSNSVEIAFAGNDGGLLDDLVAAVPNVRNLGILPLDQCDRAMESADILLSIGNCSPYLVPSKLFKYISTGKPIIHLARGKDDSCLPYLEKYPLSLILDEESADISAEFSLFLQKLQGCIGADIDLESIYPAAFPNYTVGLIQSLHEYHLYERKN